jgi:catechol 2,3-dioxygenase-like lactoylglutathione lyase family enzyme
MPGNPRSREEVMFDQMRVYAALPATDLERAKRFYAEKLGLTPQEHADELKYECGDGSAFFVFPTSISKRGGHTQAGIGIQDIEAAVGELRSRGVAFEEYETPELRTVDGIATQSGGDRAAWFTDSEGNMLALVQFS